MSQVPSPQKYTVVKIRFKTAREDLSEAVIYQGVKQSRFNGKTYLWVKKKYWMCHDSPRAIPESMVIVKGWAMRSRKRGVSFLIVGEIKEGEKYEDEVIEITNFKAIEVYQDDKVTEILEQWKAEALNEGYGIARDEDKAIQNIIAFALKKHGVEVEGEDNGKLARLKHIIDQISDEKIRKELIEVLKEFGIKVE